MRVETQDTTTIELTREEAVLLRRVVSEYRNPADDEGEWFARELENALVLQLYVRAR